MRSSPYQIILINMPFARLSMPSIALTQLSAVLQEQFGNRIEVKILYLNLDFQAYLGDISLYDHTHSSTAFMTGIGAWFFRQSAFPDAKDNLDAYYKRYYSTQDEATQDLWHRLQQKRDGVDAFFNDLIDQHSLAESDLVGFTTLFSQTTASIAMSRLIKNRNPDVHTVIGGAPCDALMGMALARNVTHIDAVFSGPALTSFPEYVGGLIGERQLDGDAIDGVFTQTNRERWPESGHPSAIAPLGTPSDINANIPLDYNSFLTDLDTAFPDGNMPPALLFETSRGCWWAQKKACLFCGLNGLHVQHQTMQPKTSIAHIESLYQYVPRCQIFLAVDTALPKSYTRDVFPHISPPESMTIFYELRPHITAEELQVLVDAGVRAFQPGIESLATSSLKLMNKGTSAFQNIIFLKHCSAHTVRLDWNLLVFTPGENESVYKKNLEDIPNLTHLAPPSGAFPVDFVRFSHYFENPEDFNLDLKPRNFYEMTYPFDRQSVTDLAYNFVDRNADTAHIETWLDRLNSATSQWSQRWHGSDEMPQARLCFASDELGYAVYDSRNGQEIETEINATEKLMLDALNRPSSKASLLENFGSITTKSLDKFKKNGWLFEENGVSLSLITQT